MDHKALDLYNKVKEFISSEIIPNEKSFFEYAQSSSRWTPNPAIEKLKVKKNRAVFLA